MTILGIEAGGHGGSEAPPLLTLLQAILAALPNGPLVVAAGGVSSGKQVAALLTMGAAGVVLGTRFLFTDECIYSPAMKDVIVKTGIIDSTIRTLAFDEVGKTNFWPPKHDGRAIKNNIIQDVEEGLTLDQRLGRFAESAASGDSSRLIIWAGQGVGITDKITSAEVRFVFRCFRDPLNHSDSFPDRLLCKSYTRRRLRASALRPDWSARR